LKVFVAKNVLADGLYGDEVTTRHAALSFVGEQP
jgi:hypothetical protein